MSLSTHMDLLQIEPGVTSSMTDSTNLAGTLTKTTQEGLQAVIWDEACMASTAKEAGDSFSAHPHLQHQAT